MTARCHILTLSLMVLLLSSCTHKDLDFGDQASVTVRFDWSSYPDVSPEMTRVAVFNESAQPVFFPFNGCQGGAVNLYKGYTYDFIGYNSDTEVLFTSGSAYSDFLFCCMPTELATFSPMFAPRRAGEVSAPRAPGTESYEVVAEPDPLWYSTAQNVEIRGSQMVDMPMRSAVCYYTFNVRDVENLSNVVNIVATISGMSGGWKPVDHRCTDTQAIIPFTMDKVDDTTIRGAVDTFGHCPQAETHYYEHKLVLYTEMVDGSKFYYTFDVTGQMHDADHLSQDGTGNTDTPIVIKGLPLPKPLINGSGLQPEVTEWNEVDIGIDL